jgi:hypothetical protein
MPGNLRENCFGFLFWGGWIFDQRRAARGAVNRGLHSLKLARIKHDRRDVDLILNAREGAEQCLGGAAVDVLGVCEISSGDEVDLLR